MNNGEAQKRLGEVSGLSIWWNLNSLRDPLRGAGAFLSRLPQSLSNGLLFAQGFLCQTIQVCVRYRGKKALSIKLVVHDTHNGNQGCRDQNTQHTEGGDT